VIRVVEWPSVSDTTLVPMFVRAVEVPAGLLFGGSRGVALGFLQARMQEGDQLVHAVTLLWPRYAASLLVAVVPIVTSGRLAAAEEIDALNVALRAADRAAGHDLAAGWSDFDFR